MPSELVKSCSNALSKMKLSIAFAESATAGRLSAEFALTEDSGQVLKGGLICYDACIKEDLLGVSKELVEKYTPESAEVTAAAAKGLQSLIPADVHVAITGLTAAGGSETPEKPVGTVFIHGLYKDKSFSDRVVFKGNSEEIILQAIDQVARLLLDKLR